MKRILKLYCVFAIIFFVFFCKYSFAQTTYPVLFKDMNVNGSSNPSNFYVSNDKMFFTTLSDGDEMYLWVTNGTADGTIRLKKIIIGEPVSDIDYWVTFNNDVYFMADDGIHGYELWKSDGTEGGTYLVKDINPEPHNGQYGATNLINFNGKIYFSARDSEKHQLQLWESDGTEAGTIQSCKFDDENIASVPSYIDTLSGYLYFCMSAGTKPSRIYRINGKDKPELFYTPNEKAGIYFLHYHNRLLYFVKYNERNSYEIWRTDGTKAGTFRLTIMQRYQQSSIIHQFNDGGKYLYFSGNDGNGNAVWRTDGTVNGTILVKRIDLNDPHTHSNQPRLICISTDKEFLFVAMNAKTQKASLYKTDGTPENTIVVMKEVRDFRKPVFFEGKIYFSVRNPEENSLFTKGVLWITDGTNKGTHRVKSKQLQYTELKHKSSSAIFKGDLYITYNEEAYGTELFRITKQK